MPNFWRVVNDVIFKADVLLLVLDARLVEQTRNAEIEQKARKAGKPIIYVLTKSDLVRREDAEKWKRVLSPCAFVSSKEYQGMKKLKERIMIEAKSAGVEGKAKVGVLGYPNVGKSSLINALKGTKSAPISSQSGRTKGMQKIRARGITLIDTPGVIPYMEKDSAKHTIIGSIDYSKSKDPELAAVEIMESFPGKIEGFYGVAEKEDKEESLNKIAVKLNFIAKGGKPDTARAARKVLKDWQEGRINQ